MTSPLPGNRPGGGGPERDRDLPEDVTGSPFADHALDAVDELDHFDPTLEQSEERWLVSFVNRVLASAEADVGRDATEPLAISRLEIRKHRDPTDLVRRHHPGQRRGQPEHTALMALSRPSAVFAQRMDGSDTERS